MVREHLHHAAHGDSMRQEKYPGSSEGQFLPCLHPTLAYKAAPAFLFILFYFFRILAAFLRYNEIQCAFDKSMWLFSFSRDLEHFHLLEGSNQVVSIFLVPVGPCTLHLVFVVVAAVYFFLCFVFSHRC